MSNTTVRITSEAKTSEAQAEVVHYSQGRRTGLGIAWLTGGILAAGAALIVPTPHIFCTTWLFPLIGGAVGYMTFKTEVRVSDIQGPCPACDEKIRLVGGTSETLELKCPKCFKPLVVEATGSAPAA